MKIKIKALFVASLVLGPRPGLLAQYDGSGPGGGAPNPNSGDTSGLYQTTLSQATLIATTADGRDVSDGLTVPVGQPIPTVTFTLGGADLPTIGSWSVLLAPTSFYSLPLYGIAPGLEVIGITGTATLSNSPIAQLVGTPTQTGTFDIGLTASTTTRLSTSTFDYFIRVTAAPATTFTMQPASQSVAVGQSVTLTAAAAGSPTYQWSGPGGVISGATGSSLTLTNVQMSAAGAYSVTATVTGGSVTSNSATLTVLPLSMPVITQNPTSMTVASGHSGVFSVTASGEEPPTYQWSLNSVPISGATDPILEVQGATSANAGAYSCTASNASGSATSTSATLTIATTSNPGYLINLSARANVGTGNNILIGGFAIGGTGTKQLLVRGVGPALTVALGGSGELASPQLTLLDNAGLVIASDIGWGNPLTDGPSAGSDSPQLASGTLMDSLGAAAYTAGSADTATVLTAPAGNGTAEVSGVGGASGIALVEFYDADTGTPTARLINISARADVGTGNNLLIGGFVIGGSTAETVLIRAVGPGLVDSDPTDFSLATVLNQPVLTLLNSSGAAIYSNTVWGGDATIASVFPTVGAFGLNSAHADSALLVTLPPGNYTAEVSGLNGGTGIALCEVYELP